MFNFSTLANSNSKESTTAREFLFGNSAVSPNKPVSATVFTKIADTAKNKFSYTKISDVSGVKNKEKITFTKRHGDMPATLTIEPCSTLKTSLKEQSEKKDVQSQGLLSVTIGIRI